MSRLRGFGVVAILLAGCAGAPPVAVGARPSEVAVVDLDAKKPAPVTVPSVVPSAEPEAPTKPDTERARDDEERFGEVVGNAGETTFVMGGLGLAGTGFGSVKIPIGKAPPTLRVGAAEVVGKLPKEIVQRIVQQNLGRFRLCYARGLEQNAKLAGRVVTRFVVGKDGAVLNSVNAASTVPDANVVACVVRGFGTLAFPKPDGGGIVVVIYPLTFAPGDDAPVPKPSP